MANSSQARKRVKQSDKARAANMPVRTNLRTWIKRVKAAIAAGDASKAREHFLTTQQVIDKAAKKGLLNKNTASRYKSRLSARIKSISA